MQTHPCQSWDGRSDARLRVVQATTFQALYKRRWGADTLREEYVEIAQRWFEPDTLLESQPYPTRALILEHADGSSCNGVVRARPLFRLIYQVSDRKPLCAGSALVFVATAIIVGLRIRRVRARQRLLEKGILSIHSCAVMWHAVAVAHCGHCG